MQQLNDPQGRQHQVAGSTHQSIERAIAILGVFTEHEPEIGVGEIARRLDLHKSTVSRILTTLLDESIVWHHPETGKYSLGMGLVELAGVALGQIDVRAAAMPHMEELGAALNETVTVSVLRGSEAVTVAHLPANQSIRHVAWIGRRIPLRATASGKVFLAAYHATGQDWTELAGLH
ncbi:MAG: IclR family transcriptional regulator, partial [Acidimicrobiia bacterium]|nr:IclR family transcriptional regulator [Acidimicrobiia bacterium]